MFGSTKNHEPIGPDRSPRFAFIDAGNVYQSFCKALKRAGISEDFFDCFSLKPLFSSYERRYVYYARKGSDPLPFWIKELQEGDGFILRLSRATQKKGQTKQEGVDVQLAIEAIQHSYRGTMASCGIFSGDGDFLPLIDALTNNGTFVTVHDFSNPNIGTVSPELRNRADRYEFLNTTSVIGCLDSDGEGLEPIRKRLEIGAKHNAFDDEPECLTIDGEQLKIWERKSNVNGPFKYLLRDTPTSANYPTYEFKSVRAVTCFYRLIDETERLKIDKY